MTSRSAAQSTHNSLDIVHNFPLALAKHAERVEVDLGRELDRHAEAPAGEVLVLVVLGVAALRRVILGRRRGGLGLLGRGGLGLAGGRSVAVEQRDDEGLLLAREFEGREGVLPVGGTGRRGSANARRRGGVRRTFRRTRWWRTKEGRRVGVSVQIQIDRASSATGGASGNEDRVMRIRIYHLACHS